MTKQPLATAPPDAPDDVLAALVGRLTLADKVRLLTGRDFWTTWPEPSIGLRSMVLSDGPSGVRGESWDERSPSLNLPSASALSASWDLDLAGEYGACLAAEARRKGVDIVLGPTVNLHRSPLSGRHFEAFSEDPLLSGEVAAACVRGMQAGGVAATPKHYVANDYETERFTASTEVDQRTLREVYLLPFERAVVDGGAWLVMSAYNAINGTTATEHDLLETPLCSEWGFDGVVVSDWTAVRSIAAARASQDLVMPGPDGAWGQALVDAVERGEVSERAIDRKVLRLLRLASRVGALDGLRPAVRPPSVDGIGLARRAAADGMVLVRNDHELPWAAPGSVAVIGHNAVLARTQGGGSATVIPESVVSPLEGIRAALPEARITYELGAVVQEGVAPFPLDQMTNPTTGESGAHVRLLSADGAELFAEDRFAADLVYFGGDVPVAEAHTVELATRLTPATTGTTRVGFAAVGHGRVEVDGRVLGEKETVITAGDHAAALLAPPSASFPVDLVAGLPVNVVISITRTASEGLAASSFAATFGFAPGDEDPEELIASAVRAAAAAETAVVVVGTSAAVESEGFDRTDLALPGRQDDLVAAVAAANPRTVVVVNSGSPVLMPWRESVAAVVLTWFGGQEYGHALADVLTGAREPGGRLPTTWPVRQEDVPVIDVSPIGGRLVYSEGIHVGHRAWLRAGRNPAYPFGFGLGYTTWRIHDLSIVDRTPDEGFVVDVGVTNTGLRAGKHVVQVYAERPDSSVERPVRWLVGFATVRAAARETVRAEVVVSRRALAHWDEGWRVEPGRFTLRVGHDVLDLPLSTVIDVRV